MKENYSGIWIFAEQRQGVLNPVVFELLSKAQELKSVTDETITAVLLGSGVSGLADELIARGAERVLIAEHEALSVYSARPYQQALTQLVERYKPSILLYGATSQGRDLAPRMMVALQTGLTADAIDLGYDEDGVFFQATPAYGGKILAHIVILEKRPQMATVRPQIFDPLPPDSTRRGEIVTETVEVAGDGDYEVLACAPKPEGTQPIDRAALLVSGGRGIKHETDFAMLDELARLLHGQLASSRPPVDQGWLPHEKQIGQSGTTVKPAYILNVGISGSVQYQVGMQNAACIISINHNPDAPIFGISQYGVVADYRKVVPAIIAEICKRKA
ncbi:MAG: electron transfer flavoprotein subunit alpha/FixB family protein [Oscillospiraceae bacterium]|nr:electron transfer flavoprotein subunit alpha/FixB family protein [Oscillospiraceae bacterium]